MTSRTTRRFCKTLAALPTAVRQQARRTYRLFEQDPSHWSLRFKQVHPSEPIFSVRVSQDCRALGVREGNAMIWFWIGWHADYERLLRRR